MTVQNSRWSDDAREAMTMHSEDAFIESLRRFSLAKEEELRNVCASNQDELRTSLDDVARLKQDVASLDSLLSRRQSELAKAISSVNAKSELQESTCCVLRYIDASIVGSQQCLELAELAIAADKFLCQNQTYHAIKVVQQVKHGATNCQSKLFREVLENWCVNTTAFIQNKAEDIITAWINDSRALSEEVGSLALEVYKPLLDGDDISAVELPPFSEKEEDGVDENCYPVVDLASEFEMHYKQEEMMSKFVQRLKSHARPVLGSIHVFRSMNELAALQKLYRTHRSTDLQLTAFIPENTTNSVIIDDHDSMLKRLVGLIMIETSLAKHSCEALQSRSGINSILKPLIEQLSSRIMEAVDECRSWKKILELKDMVFASCKVLMDQGTGVDVSCLLNALVKLSRPFRHCLMEETKQQLLECTQSDPYRRARVARKELHKMLSSCKLTVLENEILTNMDESDEMVLLPFTETVPKTFHALKTFINGMLSYGRCLGIPDWDGTVQSESMDIVMYVDGQLNKIMNEQEDISEETVISIGCNAACLVTVSDLIQRSMQNQKVMKQVGLRSNAVQPIHHLPTSKQFPSRLDTTKQKLEKTTTRAQDVVCELMLTRVEELIDPLYHLDWSPPTSSLSPHLTVWELVKYLRTTFTYLESLPTSAKDGIRSTVARYINTGFQRILCGTTIKKLSYAGVLSLKCNLEALTSFIDSLEVPQLSRALCPVQELTELLLSEDAYKPDILKQESNLYSHVKREDAAVALGKMKDDKEQVQHKKVGLLGKLASAKLPSSPRMPFPPSPKFSGSFMYKSMVSGISISKKKSSKGEEKA